MVLRHPMVLRADEQNVRLGSGKLVLGLLPTGELLRS